MQIICMVMLCQNFSQLTDSNGFIIRNLTETNITKIVQKVVFSKLILNILKNYSITHNDCPLAVDTVRIKEMFSHSQILIADFNNIPILNVKKLVPILYVKLNAEKRLEAEKNGDKYEKALYILMNNNIYGKTME